MSSWHKARFAAAGLLLALGSLAQAGEPPKESPATLQFELAQKLRLEKLPKLAISQYEKFVALYRKDSRYAEALFWLADCHYQLQQHQYAAKYYEELCREHNQSPRYAMALLRLGHCRLVLGQHDPAIAALLQLDKLPPPADLASSCDFYLGRAYYNKADYNHALARFEKVLADKDAQAQFRSLAMFWAGDVHQRTSRFEQAVAAYLRLLEQFPDVPLAAEANFRLGECYQRLGQDGKAVERFAAAEKAPRLAASSLYLRALSLFRLKKYAQALAPAQQLLTKFADAPHAAEAYALVGRCQFELKQYDKAAQSFGTLAEKFPDAPDTQEAMLKACWCWYYLGDKHNTARMKACLSYLDKHPNSPGAGDAHYLLADAYAAIGQFDRALASFKAVPEASAYYQQARFRVALTHHQRRDLPASAQAYDKLVAAFPNHPHADYALMQAGLIYYHLAGLAKDEASKQQLYAQAEQRLGQFVKRFPTHEQAPQMLFTKGQAQRLQNKHDEMAATFEQYAQIKAAPHAGTALFWIGRYRQRAGDELGRAAEQALNGNKTAEARDLYRQAVVRHLRAIDAYKQSLQHAGPAQKEARARLAEACYAVGASQAAEARYLAADAEAARGRGNERQAQMLENRRAELAKLGDEALDAAVAAYEHVMKEAPQLVANDKIYKWVAARLRARGQPARAIAHYKALLELWPKVDYRDRVLCELGTLCTELPKPDWQASAKYFQQALDEYAQLAKTAPAKPRPLEHFAQYGKALALKNSDKLDAASELFRQVIDSVPDGEVLNVRSRVELGEIAFKQGEALAAAKDRDAAAQKYLEARNLFVMVGLLFDDPDLTPRSLFWAGLCGIALDEVDEGARVLSMVLKKHPDSEWARRARQELKRRGIVVDKAGNIVP